jgi:hypothetical protein
MRGKEPVPIDPQHPGGPKPDRYARKEITIVSALLQQPTSSLRMTVELPAPDGIDASKLEILVRLPVDQDVTTTTTDGDYGQPTWEDAEWQ